MGGNATSVLIKADSEKNVEKVFKDFDKDKNGTLEKGEWLKVAQLLWKERKKFGLDLEEYHDESTVAYFAAEIFKHVDKNNDEVISFSEFWNFFKSIADGKFHFGPMNGENTGELLSVEREHDYILPINEIQHRCLICKKPASSPTMILEDNVSLFCRTCIVDELTLKKYYSSFFTFHILIFYDEDINYDDYYFFSFVLFLFLHISLFLSFMTKILIMMNLSLNSFFFYSIILSLDKVLFLHISLFLSFMATKILIMMIISFHLYYSSFFTFHYSYLL
jgi:hypothetical protein